MRADVKSELQMLRELCWWFLPQLNCCFCGEPLLVRPAGMTFGHRRHPKVDVKLTLHHREEDRSKNAFMDVSPCHSPHHKGFHASKRGKSEREDITNEQKGQEVKEGQVVEVKGEPTTPPFIKEQEDDCA